MVKKIVLGAAAGLCLIGLVCYLSLMAGALSKYVSGLAVVFMLLALFSYSMAFIKPVRAYCAPAMFVFSFIAFIVFVYNGYMYFSEVFYGGLSAEAFMSIDSAFMGTLITYLLSFITAIVCIFLPEQKEKNLIKNNGVIA